MQSRHQLVGNLKTRTLRTFNSTRSGRGPTSMRDLEQQIWMGITKKEKKNYIKKEIIKEARPCDVCFEKTSAERRKEALGNLGLLFAERVLLWTLLQFRRGRLEKKWHNLLKETFPIYKWQTQKAGIMRKTWKWTAFFPPPSPGQPSKKTFSRFF